MNVTEAIRAWSLNESLAKNLVSTGVESFFPVQVDVIPKLLQQNANQCIEPQDICVSAPTGSGKTLSYAVPIVNTLLLDDSPRLRALILLPSRELANQVYEVFCKLTSGTSLKIAVATGQTDFEQEQRLILGAFAPQKSNHGSVRAVEEKFSSHHPNIPFINFNLTDTHQRPIRTMIKSREDIPLSSRIVIKAGTAVISNPDGYPSLTRMADLVEQCARLVHSGKEVILVSSGAVGVGKRRLAKQGILRRSMSDFLIERDPMHHLGAVPAAHIPVAYTGASAAAGQLGIMSLYEQMFTQYDITISQLLVTTEDFTSPQRRRNIQYVIKQLLALGIIPIINENDAISASFVETTVAPVFSDNDSLASMVSVEMNAHLLILLTDVAGVFDRPPSETGAKLIDIFGKSTGFKVGSKSTQGRGGMGAKVNAALAAIRGGVSAVAIAAGTCSGVVGSILHGEKCGTLFLSEILDQYHVEEVPVGPANTTADGQKLIRDVSDGSSTITEINPDVETIAQGARMGGRELQALSADERTNIVLRLAKYIEDRAHLILAANEDDLAAAVQNGLNLQLLNRLRLTKDKIFTLVKGIRAVAAQEDPIGKLLGKTELAEGLILDKVSCPIGVLLVIFESRPDCLPQIAALALRSGNGLVLKGGKEAETTNGCLYAIVRDAIHDATDGAVSSDTIGLVQSHDEINELLKLDDLIDLVIPRGSNSLVSFIQSHTRIPVMGHADGVCHVYVDADADMAMAARIVIDSKIDYPSACNAAESLLIHECHVNTGAADKLLRALRSKGVALYGGPEAVKQGLTEQIAVDLHREYGDLQITVEVVRSMQHAVQHINTHGSGHTECIVTENAETAELFTRTADSACVFHNASTRFADGFRFGLGAEVGISTGRIHARGPVGVEGLLTTKWLLRSSASSGHIASSFAGPDAQCVYTHKSVV